jgi:magnesium-transporting ATPase (P-type)
MGVFSNPWIWAGITAMMLAQAALIYLPAMNWLFHTVPIGLDEWLLAIGSGLLIYLVVGMEKMIRRRLNAGSA